MMALTGWLRNSSAARILSNTAHASLDTLRQTTKSNSGSGIPPAMALASAALLGVVSTFSWSNVLNAGKLKANVEHKQARQQQEKQDGAGEDSNEESSRVSGFVTNASDFARRELDTLFRP